MADIISRSTGTATNAIEEIEAYEREYQAWEKRGESIVSKYRDEKTESTSAEIIQRKFNILWANTEVLAPTLYARLPRVEVERRFKDRDPVGRSASIVAERLGSYVLETTHTNEVLKATVLDMLLPGRGTAWVKYEAEMTQQPVTGPDGQPMLDPKGKPMTQPVKSSEKIEPIYIDWKDFGHQAKRNWQEVDMIWRRVFMTRTELVKRFGEELAAKIALDRRPTDRANNVEEIKDKATIYEVWDRARRKVCWVSLTQPDYLEEIDPPIDLEGFWPTPRPLCAVMTNGTLVPVPLFTLYQDQAAELDKITNRIGRLTDALKVAGVYDASVPDLQRLLSPNGVADNTLIPVDNWMALSEKGKLSGSIDLIPLDMIASVLVQCYTARDQVKQTIYEITGLSDILRGATDPGETLGAQQLKSQYGSIRIRNLQAEVARFARDIARIVVEIGVEMFEPLTIYQMIGGEQVMPPEEFQAALELLRNDRLRSFHIDIETDSTVAMDESADKQSAQEFVTVMGTFMKQSSELVAQAPMLAPLIGETMTFLVRRYRAGRTLEASIEQAMQQIAQQAQNPQPPPPDPALLIAQEKTKQDQIKFQGDQAQRAADREFEERKFQGEMQVKQGSLQNDTRRVELDEWQAGHEVEQSYKELKQTEDIEDRRIGHELNKLERGQMFERERGESAKAEKAETLQRELLGYR